MRWATLQLKIPDNWMTQLLHDNNDLHIRVFGCIPYQSRGGRGLVRIGSDENLDAILNIIRSRKDVVKASFSHESDRAVMGEVVIDRCAACIALKQSDCFMVSSKSRSGGWLEWAVAAESNSTIHDLARTMDPRYTMTPLGRRLRESNPWYQAETPVDLALGYRYSCVGGYCQGINSDTEQKRLRRG